MKRLCLLVALLAACSEKRFSGPFVFEDPHPEAKEIVYVPPAPSDPAAPVIDEIRVAKDVVCDGESNLVRVKAHTKDGHDAYLVPNIFTGLSVGSRGPVLPVVFVSSMTDHGDRGWPEVRVFDWGPHGATMPESSTSMPNVVIRPCRYPELRIDLWPLSNTDSTYQFEASAQNADGFEPVSYHWEFGDGTTGETTGPTVSHDYWRMPEATAELMVLVKVSATDAREQTVTGYVAFDRSSMEYSYRTHGRRYVHSQMIGDRTVDANGVVYQDWLLWHHEDAPVVLDRAELGIEGPTFDLSLAATLAGASSGDSITLPPGEQVRVTVHHDFSSHPDLMAISFWLTNGDPQPAVADVTVFNPI